MQWLYRGIRTETEVSVRSMQIYLVIAEVIISNNVLIPHSSL